MRANGLFSGAPAGRRVRLGVVGAALMLAALESAAADSAPTQVPRATAAGPGTAPAIAAASNFGHHAQRGLFDRALELGVSDFRDTISWTLAETEPGVFAFDRPTTSYPAKIAAAGGRMSLTVNWGNDLYDGGDTPYTDAGRAALARFVVAALDAHPAIMAVEVGNEINGPNFVTGPVKEAVRAERAAVYFPLLKAVYEAVKSRHPDVAVLGGAAHSIPAGFLWPLLDLGAADYMDALVLHPYSTPPEQLMRQIAVLRRHPAAARLPIQVTEFGEKDPDSSPGYLLRMYCAMALAGVERAVWYPLGDRGDDMQPLIDPTSGERTPAGRAFTLVQTLMAGQPVEDVSADPFTYACLFGERTLVIWGEPRGVTVAAGVTVRNAVGSLLDPNDLRLSMSEPILATADEPIVLGETLRLERSFTLADSYHQFGYPEGALRSAADDPFQRFARRVDRRVRLYAMLGQDAGGTLWTPYLGNRFIRPAHLNATHLVPGGNRMEPVEIVHRYVADRPQTVAIEASWSPAGRYGDGIDIEIRRNDDLLHGKRSARTLHEVSLPMVALKQGDRLDFIVGPGEDARGDRTAYRILLREIGD